ncbi:hypothetical protein BD413DRAFT_11628 [Trametes elegans]|nr:hypothetical protein BD413DRAFT_11628 [Trametes elegans]
MVNSLSVYRYSCFALFIVCNAVLCCVSVWNLALAQELGWNPLIDAYLIALSSFGLLYIFPIMCIDLLRKNSLVGRVWFECVWVGLFWLAELAGAAALSAILPNMTCSAAVHLLLPPTCTSTRVLLAFTWIGAINLLVYFCILMVSAIIHMKDDSQIWRGNVRMYPWYKVREALPSSRSSPFKPWSKPSAPSAAPQIRLSSDIISNRLDVKTRASFDTIDEKRSAPLKHTPLVSSKVSAKNTPNKSALILQSAWISATVTPASPPSGESDEYTTSSSDGLTSTATGIPPSAHYVPYSSTLNPSPLGSGPPPRSSSLSATFGGKAHQLPPLSAASHALPPSAGAPSPQPQPAQQQSSSRRSGSGARPKTKKRKPARPPPLDMSRLHTYGR